MLSVVDDFNELKKYNVESILGSNKKAEDSATATATKEAEVEADEEVKVDETKEQS